jgi:hypothetical protein
MRKLREGAVALPSHSLCMKPFASSPELQKKKKFKIGKLKGFPVGYFFLPK